MSYDLLKISGWISDGWILHVGLFRSTNVLKHYRGFEVPAGDRVKKWLGRLFTHPCFKATTSTEDLYLDSYERYVKLSQV